MRLKRHGTQKVIRPMGLVAPVALVTLGVAVPGAAVSPEGAMAGSEQAELRPAVATSGPRGGTGARATRVDFNPRESRLRYGQVAEFDFNPEDIKAERDFGREVAAHLLGRYALDESSELNRYLSLVGKNLAEWANRPEIEFHVGVLDSDAVSAFAAPGGYIFVSRGALRLMRDEAELAGVLGHEIIHVTERHIVHELDIRGGESGVVSGLARIIGGSGDPARAAFSQAVDQAMAILLEEGLSQEDELEADSLGTFLATQAGYDPRGLPRFLERIASRDSGEREDILANTHPPYATRLSSLGGFLADNDLDELEQPRLEERFQQHVAR